MAYKKIESYDEDVTSALVENFAKTIALLGEDVKREGLEKTPERICSPVRF